jgi:hypothetical protein
MYSNCLLEALKEKVKHPFSIVIRKRRGTGHFYWYDKHKKSFFHFTNFCGTDCYIWHEGEIRKIVCLKQEMKL